jgi:phage terminase large subunit GpA-like protein
MKRVRLRKNEMQQYASAHSVVKYTSELLLPPRRLKPSVAAVQSLRNEKGAYDARISPMMEEPLDLLGGRDYTGIIFIGPARCSKTYSLILGGLVYVQTCAPGDALIVQMSGDAARDFSRGDLDKCIRHSPDLRARLSPRARDDNTHDKFWRTGTSLKIGWPAVSQLSSKTLQYVFITDYDRPECRDNVDGEGPMWDLASKRVETYMSRGKCLAESSPGEEFNDPQWHPVSEHEAPPAAGIMSLYNRGTRARWYWPCLHCRFYFEAKPGLELFNLPEFEEIERLVKKQDPMTLADKFAVIACPDCGAIHKMKERSAMNLKGTWVHEGQKIDDRGRAVGQRRRSTIASYWLGGVAATYQRWDGILQKYFHGVMTYTRSGDESALKATTMTDQALPYTSRSQAKARGPEALMGRREKWEKGTVPIGVRFLITTIDVQAHRFVVQVHGFGIGLECWLVDRYDITSSNRVESKDHFAAIDPAAYLEDWNVLIDLVIKRKFPLAANDQVMMGSQLVLCDSGGKEGVTTRAYDFWRSLKKAALANAFQLVKGDPRLNAPRVVKAFPDTRNRKDRASSARGDVPVWLLNVNLLKDGVSNDLARDVPGPGFVHFPLWADDEFFAELMAETRGVKGWEKRHGVRNEAGDLYTYARAGCVMLRAETIDWSAPPVWAADPTTIRAVMEKRVDLAAVAGRLNE